MFQWCLILACLKESLGVKSAVPYFSRPIRIPYLAITRLPRWCGFIISPWCLPQAFFVILSLNTLHHRVSKNGVFASTHTEADVERLFTFDLKPDKRPNSRCQFASCTLHYLIICIRTDIHIHINIPATRTVSSFFTQRPLQYLKSFNSLQRGTLWIGSAARGRFCSKRNSTLHS